MDISILRGGCNQQHPTTFVQSRPNGLPNYLLLVLRSHGEFSVGKNRHYSIDPGNVIIFAPDISYTYHNPEGDYVDDWLHFMPKEGRLLADTVPLNTPFPVDDSETCSTLIRQLLWELSYTDHEYAAENINSLFQVLINHLSAAYNHQEHVKKATPYHQQLKQLRFSVENSLQEPHTIRLCADKLGLSETYFQTLYTSQFGIPFQRDLINMRISLAKFNLESTDMPVGQIAALCGYTTEVHFYRQFKKIAGITPAKYRKLQYTVSKL